MEATRNDHGDHVVRISPAPSGRPQDTKGADRKHLPQAQSQARTPAPPSFLRLLSSSRDADSAPAGRPLPERQRQALRPPPPVVGTIASHEVRSDEPWTVRALSHLAILGAGALAGSFTALARSDEDYDDAASVTAGALTSALLYASCYGGPRVRDWWAARQERNRIESQHLNAGQQLDRVVELANAQALTTAGLRHAVARIVQLGTLHPADLPPARLADAIAQLARCALDLPRNGQDAAPGYEGRVGLICQALLDLHTVDGLEATACARALRSMVGHIGPLVTGLPPGVRRCVLDLSIQSLERLHGSAGGLADAEYATHLAKLARMTVLASPETDEAVWTAMRKGLPGGNRPPLDALINRVASVRPVYRWLLDRTVIEIAHRQGDALHRDLGAMRTYMDQVVRLAGALAPALSPQGLRHLVLEHLWAPALREREGAGREALARMPALSAALRWHLDEARARALADCLVDTTFFNTNLEAAFESQHLAALVCPQTPATARIALHEAARKISPTHASRHMQDLLAPVTLAALLEKMPAQLLPREAPAALQHARDTLQALDSSVEHLRIMSILSKRKDAPAGAFLRGLAEPGDVVAMIRDVASSGWHHDTLDRARLIASLPQLCQASATEELVQQAVQALRDLPELTSQGLAPQEYEWRRQKLLTCIKAACEGAGKFICSEDERQARARDAHSLVPVAEDFDSQPGPRAANAQATIDHAWLTPAFIERMLAPSLSKPERKHA